MKIGSEVHLTIISLALENSHMIIIYKIFGIQLIIAKYNFKFVKINIFNFLNKLFLKSSAPNNQNANLKPCYFDKLFHNLQMDITRQFFNEYIPKPGKRNVVNQNFWAQMFMNEMSHDYLERLFWVDDDMVEFLKELLTPAFLENTLVIVMGIKTDYYLICFLLNL